MNELVSVHPRIVLIEAVGVVVKRMIAEITLFELVGEFLLCFELGLHPSLSLESEPLDRREWIEFSQFIEA